MERYFMNFSIVPFLRGIRPAPMRAIAGSAAFAAAALLLPPLPAQAATGSWTSTGPYGGIVQTLVVDPKTPATLYAASAGGGVFKSIDRGANWAPATTGLTDPTVFTLVIDPANSSKLYAGCANGLFKSIDGAANWTQVPSVPNNIFNIHDIVIDPKTPSTLYAVTDGGDQVQKSVDGGKTWTQLSGLDLVSGAVLAVDPVTPSTLYAGSSGLTTGNPPGGIYKSIDGGNTWTLSTAGLGTSFIDPTQIWVDPDNTAIVYAAINNNYLTKSRDGGVTWTTVPTTISGGLTVTTMDPSNPHVFYAINELASAIYRTQNGGKAWTALAPVTPDTAVIVNTVAVDPANANRLYAGTTHGVHASTDLGTTWSAANQGLANTLVTALALDPAAPATLYAGTERSGIFKTTNGGLTWTRLFDTGKVSALLIDPANSAKLYFSDQFGTGVFKSINAGASWTSVLPSQTINAMALDPLTPGTVYAVGGNLFGSVAKSIDGGKTWHSANTGLAPTYNPESVSADGAFVLLTDPQNGAFLSKNGGMTWTATGPPAPAAAARSGAKTPRATPIQPLILNFADGLLLGAAAEIIDAVIGKVSPDEVDDAILGFLKLSILPGSSGVAPAAGPQAGTANPWTPWDAPAGLSASDCLPITALAADPVTPATFYAGGLCGVLKGTVLGASTTTLGAGLPVNVPVDAIAITPTAGDLYAATYGGGVYHYTVPAE
jgi:photosystem II stability/assembly factor-like uncharacterized protein